MNGETLLRSCPQIQSRLFPLFFVETSFLSVPFGAHPSLRLTQLVRLGKKSSYSELMSMAVKWTRILYPFRSTQPPSDRRVYFTCLVKLHNLCFVFAQSIRMTLELPSLKFRIQSSTLFFFFVSVSAFRSLLFSFNKSQLNSKSSQIEITEMPMFMVIK